RREPTFDPSVSPLRRLPVIGALAAACHTGAPSTPPLRLGATYTVQQSGALAVLESLWTSVSAPRLATVIGPSGHILHAAANGDSDVVITPAAALHPRVLVAPR